MIQKKPFKTITSDGVVLKGLLIIPKQPKAIVQFNGGTAAKKEFYLPFLTYLAEHDYLCCLWDYRGSGESAPDQLKDCDYNFRDYGLKDMPAIKAYLQTTFPDLPLLLFVHSVGGQQIGFVKGLEDYIGMVGYAVSVGYLQHMPIRYRILSNYFFFIFTPLSNALFGYLRAKMFGYMEDLPKQVILEWKAWCAKKSYFFDPQFAGKTVPVKAYAGLPFPIHIFWSPDDPISNERNIHAFWSNVKSTSSINLEKIEPATFQLKKLEHFGFFRRQSKEKLWPLGLRKLDDFLAKATTKEELAEL